MQLRLGGLLARQGLAVGALRATMARRGGALQTVEANSDQSPTARLQIGAALPVSLRRLRRPFVDDSFVVSLTKAVGPWPSCVGGGSAATVDDSVLAKVLVDSSDVVSTSDSSIAVHSSWFDWPWDGSNGTTIIDSTTSTSL